MKAGQESKASQGKVKDVTLTKTRLPDGHTDRVWRVWQEPGPVFGDVVRFRKNRYEYIYNWGQEG